MPINVLDDSNFIMENSKNIDIVKSNLKRKVRNLHANVAQNVNAYNQRTTSKTKGEALKQN